MSFCSHNKFYVKSALPNSGLIRQLIAKLFSKKMPSYTFKASMTLEAAVIFPLCAGFFVSILFFFRVMQIETGIEAAINQVSREAAVNSSLEGYDSLALGMIKLDLLNRLESNSLIEEYVSGGCAGVSIYESKTEGNAIDLSVNYRVKLPVDFFDIKGVDIEQHSKSYKWIGKDISGEDDDPYVYFTDYGSVYHLKSTCNYIELSIRSVEYSTVENIRNLDGGRYYKCSCVKTKPLGGSVYVTDYGEEYHCDLNCSDLKRTIHMCHKSEIKTMGACSKCGK